MKTVQEWLKATDTETLTDTYLANYPIDYQTISSRELTLGEIRDRTRENMIDFIERMKSLEVRTDNKPMVFFACRQYDDGMESVAVSLCGNEELCTAEKPDSYAWDLTPFSEVLGYYIAETKLTIGKIYDVLAGIIEEMTFFGFDPEEREKEKAKEDLLAAIEEIEDGNCDTEKYYTLDEFRERLGMKPREPDPEGDELKRDIVRAECAYNAYQRKKEIANAVKLLKGWQKGQ